MFQNGGGGAVSEHLCPILNWIWQFHSENLNIPEYSKKNVKFPSQMFFQEKMNFGKFQHFSKQVYSVPKSPRYYGIEKNKFRSRLLNNLVLFLCLILKYYRCTWDPITKVFFFWKFIKFSLTLVINKIVLCFQFET